MSNLNRCVRPPEKFIIIFITCGSKKEAGKIVDAILNKRLAACANIVSEVESKFWWRGKIDNAKEYLIMMKARRKNFEEIEKQVKRLHSYEVPEIIAIPIVAGSKDYLKWLETECAK